MAETKKKSEILKEKYNALATLFGAKSGKKVGSSCTGKWSGTTDYSVQFDNGERFYISNGMKYFEQNLDEKIKVYSAFSSMKEDIIKALCEFEKHDNALAATLKLWSYHVVDIDYLKSGDYLGWFYAVLDINGVRHTVKETGLYYLIRNALLSGNTEEIIKEAEDLRNETVFPNHDNNPLFVFRNHAFAWLSYTADDLV